MELQIYNISPFKFKEHLSINLLITIEVNSPNLHKIDISSKCFNFLVESFGLVLDLTNNYPKINKDLDLLTRFNDSNDLDSDNSYLSDIIMGEYNISDISEDEN